MLTLLLKKIFKIFEPIYKLSCILNKNFLIQNRIKTSDYERYNLYDYSYTSSNSAYSKSYWSKYFLNVDKYLKKHKKFQIKLKF